MQQISKGVVIINMSHIIKVTNSILLSRLE